MHVGESICIVKGHLLRRRTLACFVCRSERKSRAKQDFDSGAAGGVTVAAECTNIDLGDHANAAWNDAEARVFGAPPGDVTEAQNTSVVLY